MMLVRRIFVAGWLLSLPLPAHAQGIPVYDAASFGQFLTQLDKMAQDYQKQIEQLEEAMKQTNALTGSREMGSLMNSPLEASMRRYLPNTWQETMNIMNTSGLSGAGLQTQKTYSNLYTSYEPAPGAALMVSNPNSTAARAYDRRVSTTFAAMAAGEEAFDSIPQRMSTYESLLAELDNTQDVKASIDLLARISAENGMALNEVMRLNAIQIQQSAAKDNQIISDYTRGQKIHKFDPAVAANAFKRED